MPTFFQWMLELLNKKFLCATYQMDYVSEFVCGRTHTFYNTMQHPA